MVKIPSTSRRPFCSSGISSGQVCCTGAVVSRTVRLRSNAVSAGKGYGLRLCTPTTETVPPARTVASESSSEVSLPTASITESAPMPPVASITACTAGAGIAMAPSAAARSRRAATGSTAKTFAAPRNNALRSAQSPTAPRPITTAVPPTGMSARLAAAQPVARLSVSSSACSVLMFSGIFSSWKSAAGTASSSACAPPSTPEPKICGPDAHRMGSLVAHPAHAPQPATDEMSTRSPTFTVCTSGPASTTVPIASCPSDTGSKIG